MREDFAVIFSEVCWQANNRTKNRQEADDPECEKAYKNVLTLVSSLSRLL